jgi:phage-related protein
MSPGGQRKPLIWLSGELKTPPLSKEARVEAGSLLRQLQEGESLGMPHVRHMTTIGPRCHEIRIRDENRNWRVVVRIDPDAILVVSVFPKTTQATSKRVIDGCKKVLWVYDEAVRRRNRGD